LSDREPEALALLARNRDRNQLSAEILALDFTQPQKDLGHFDLILASDVFYGDGMMAGVLRFLRHHLGPEGLALVTDPMRVQPAGVNGAARLHGLEGPVDRPRARRGAHRGREPVPAPEAGPPHLKHRRA
jgi:SAM-dependent methyltransferase